VRSSSSAPRLTKNTASCEAAPRLCLASAVVAITACSTPDQPPTPTSAKPAPITAPPLDVSRYLTEPCSGVPTELTTRLGLPERKNAHETKLVGAGEQAECQLSSGPPLSAAAEVRFYPKARHLPMVNGPGSGVKPTTVAGYPAGEWFPGTGKDGNFTSCQIIVDIAEKQGFGTLYNGVVGQTIETSCAHARQLAEGVLAAIPR
jgi:hypothetical protein